MTRIDKYIWYVRLSKTRSLATDLVKKGKVKLNEDSPKPSREVKIGDTIHIVKNNATFSYKIIADLSNRVGAKLVDDYILNVTKPEEIDKYKTYQEAQKGYRERGSGKPSKKDRRDLEDYLDW